MQNMSKFTTMSMCIIKVSTINNLVCFFLENVALYKTAWQTNPYLNDDTLASLAVDGKKSKLSQWGGECVASDYGSTAEWRVDLKDVLSIHHVVIQYFQTKLVWGTYFHIKSLQFVSYWKGTNVIFICPCTLHLCISVLR